MKKLKFWMMALVMAVMLTACAPAAPTPSPDPTPTKPSEEQTEPTAPEPDAENLLCDKNAKANTGLLPRGIKRDHELVKTAGGTYTLYYAAPFDAFSYFDGEKSVGESTWLRQMGKEYGITVNAVRKSAATVLSAERLALLSGQKLDLMSFTPDQLPYAVGMTEDQSGFLTEQRLEKYDFLNTTLLTYGGEGIRFFTPAGVARNLWYSTADALLSSQLPPQLMAQNGEWDLSAFVSFIKTQTKVDGKKVTKYGVEIRDFADLFSAVGTPVIRAGKTFENGANNIAAVLPTVQTLSAVNGALYDGTAKKDAPSLIDGTLFCRYGQTPFVESAEKYPAFRWAPLPVADGSDDTGTVSAVAPLLALPKGSHDEGALSAALLWAARFADASHDTLRFTYGMTFDDWCSYYEMTRQSVTVTPAPEEKTAKELTRLVNSTDTDVTKLTELAGADCDRRNKWLLS